MTTSPLTPPTKAATSREMHFYLAGWNGAVLNVDANKHLQKALTNTPQSLATPAATSPVVLPEPVAWLHECKEKPHISSIAFGKASSHQKANGFVNVALYTEQQVRALLAQQLAIMPKGESAAAQLRAMATNYPSGHSWDKLDAKACIRGALEIEALRALQAGVSAPAAQAVGRDLQSVVSAAAEKLDAAKRCHPNAIETLIDEALEILDGDREPPAQADARDAAFEAVRKKFCKLQRYSFFLDDKGNVRRTPDYCGNWVEFEAVHTLFEPAAVDAAIAAQASQQGGDKQ